MYVRTQSSRSAGMLSSLEAKGNQAIPDPYFARPGIIFLTYEQVRCYTPTYVSMNKFRLEERSFFQEGYLIKRNLFECNDPIFDKALLDIENLVDTLAKKLKAKGLIKNLYEDMNYEKRMTFFSNECHVFNSDWKRSFSGHQK